MQSQWRVASQLIEKTLPVVVLAIVAVCTYALFFWMPYDGFFFDSNGNVTSVFVPTSGLHSLRSLRSGDRLQQVGDLRWEEFTNHLRLSLFGNAGPGTVVPIMVERGGVLTRIDYVLPGRTTSELTTRFINVWPVPFAFWAAGTLTLLLARPKDTTWRLLIAFNYLTALWLSAGMLSSHRLWDSAVWMRVFIWISVPVYLHLHLIFPRPLARLSRPALMMLYGAGGLLALAQFWELLPRTLYLLGFLVSIVGSAALLIIHFIVRPAERGAIGFMLKAIIVAGLPAVILVTYAVFTGYTSLTGGSVLFLPALPLAYAYAIYRRRLVGLEVRVNRAISIYSFCVVVGLLTLVVSSLAAAQASGPFDWTFVNLLVVLVIMLITLFGFNPFQQFLEQKILGIRIPPTRLLESYAAEITTTLNTERLIGYLRDDIAPSLLIRQSALMRIEGQRLLPLYASGLAPDDLPCDPAALAPQVGHYLPPGSETDGGPQPQDWLRLILPLSIESHPLGYWLLGRRDPDDYYSVNDATVLSTIANQTAIALHNILQTQRLHALYQNDIDRSEEARANLARELHDQVLNELGLLWRGASQNEQSAQMEASFQRLSSSLRQTITGLRPAAVDFGLRLALADLVDRVGGNGTTPEIELDLGEEPDDYQRHTANVELHLYRIVQQALSNAVQYSHANKIKIWGTLQVAVIELHIDDDGVGFESDNDPDVAQLVARKHFGIAGMVERAHLIGARLRVQSAPGQGTHVQLVWPQDGRGVESPMM